MERSGWYGGVCVLLLTAAVATSPVASAQAAPPFDDAGRAANATPPAPPRVLPPPPEGVIPPVADEAAASEPTPRPARPVSKQEMARSWGYSTHAPADPRYAAPREEPAMVAINPIGFYSGVSLRSDVMPRFATPAVAAQDRGVLTWTGFERDADEARIFFQISGNIDYVVQPNGGAIELRLRNVEPAARNNLRPLDLRFFPTAVQHVELTDKGPDIVARFALKKPADLDVKREERPGGFTMLVVTPRDKLVTAAQGAPE